MKLTRAQLLDRIRVAGYENDSKTYTRLLIEHRISHFAAKAAWMSGVRQRGAFNANGIGLNSPQK